MKRAKSAEHDGAQSRSVAEVCASAGEAEVIWVECIKVMTRMFYGTDSHGCFMARIATDK